MTLFGTTTPGRYCGQTQAATLRGRGQTTLCHQSTDRPFGTLQLGHATWQAQEDPRSTANGHHLLRGQRPTTRLIIGRPDQPRSTRIRFVSRVTQFGHPDFWTLLLLFITKWGRRN